MKKEKVFQIFFFVLVFLFLMWGIDLMLLTYPDEARNAYATLFMMKSGNYIVPYYNGEIRYDKPPLLYYSAILIYNFLKIFNYENIELSFRIVSVVSTTLSGLIVFELSKYFLLEKICRYFAVFLYVSMVNIFIESKAFVPEPLLSLFINFSLLAFFKIYHQFNNNKTNNPYFLKTWNFLFWVSIGLGTLSKGIVAIIVVFLVITVFLLFEKNLEVIKILFENTVYVLVGLLIGFSWFIVVGIETKGEFLYNFFWVHNFGRFTGSSNMHPNPFYFYLPVIILNTLPFIELFILFIVAALKAYLKKEKGEELLIDKKRNFLRLNFLRLNFLRLNFLWIYFGMVIIFYSLSTGKVHHYIMPSLVPLSILITFFIEKIREEKVKNVEYWVFASFIIPLILFFLEVPPIFLKLKNSILILYLAFIPIYFLIFRYNRKLIFISTFLKVIIFYGLLISNLPFIFPNQEE
ncbi:MAG: phospholipid carrier-dependent glycosyltransferase, partial [bacterium]